MSLSRAATFAAVLTAAAGAVPRLIPLSNAADAGLMYPMVGLGTAGGGTDHGYGSYPECWASCLDAQCTRPDPTGGCAQYTQAAINTWFSLGGRRLDDADSYRNQDSVGRAIRTAVARGAVPRDEVFLLTKVGPYQPLGYAEVVNQSNTILNVTGLDYVEHIQLHWPSCLTGGGCGPSTDPACNAPGGVPAATYDDAACRLNSWRALLDVWKAGKARSVGVSNFNISHLEAIRAAGLTLPSINQLSFNLYHSVSERALVEYCNANGIVVSGYVPFARPDSWAQGPPCAPTPLTEPLVVAMAARYNATPAALQLAWQMAVGVTVNPRSQSAAHMLENLGAVDLTLSDADVESLWAAPQASCSTPACTNPVPYVAGATCANNEHLSPRPGGW